MLTFCKPKRKRTAAEHALEAVTTGDFQDALGSSLPAGKLTIVGVKNAKSQVVAGLSYSFDMTVKNEAGKSFDMACKVIGTVFPEVSLKEATTSLTHYFAWLRSGAGHGWKVVMTCLRKLG